MGTALITVAACSGGAGHEEWTLAVEQIAMVAPPETLREPLAVDVDGRGLLHVLDAGHHRVAIFDADGRFVAFRGRQGAGPGELSRPTGLWVFPDGEIAVADAGNARVMRYGPAGNALPATSLGFTPLDVLGTDRYLYVLRLPPPTFIYGPGTEPLIYRADRDGRLLDGFLEPEPAEAGILYFLSNTLRLAAGPGEGIAVANTHVVSRIRRLAATGAAEGEIDVLYKAEALAPLGRLPGSINPGSLERIARTCTALVWDPGRRLYWVLAGYVDRRRDGTWVVATELYRYHPDGRYAGSVMLPYPARDLAVAHDGTLWVLDSGNDVRRLRVTDPEMARARGRSRVSGDDRSARR